MVYVVYRLFWGGLEMNLDEFYQKLEEHWKKSDRESRVIVWGGLGFVAVLTLVQIFLSL